MKSFVNHFKEHFDNVKFKFICSFRFLLLFFLKDRQIEIISQNYFRAWLFDRAYLSVDLKLRNVIWLSVNGFKSLRINDPIVLDIEKIKGEFVEIEVFGYSTSEILQIKIEGVQTLKSDSFNVITHNLKGIILSPVQIGMKTMRVEIGVLKPVLVYPDKEIIQSKLKVKSQEFNLTEFI